MNLFFKMRLVTVRLFYLAVLIVWTGCAPSISVHSDTPFPGDFTRYSTFKFFNPKNLPPANFAFSDEHKKALFDAVAGEMKARGYKSLQDADLIIKIQGSAANTIDYQEGTNYYPYDPYGYPYGYYPYNNYPYGYDNLPRDRSKKEITIIIDMIDTEKDKVVWQGVATAVLGKNETIDVIRIGDLVTQIFTKYSYRAPTGN